MHKNKLTTPLLVAGLMIACGTTYAAETAPTPPTPPKPPATARPTTIPPASTKQGVTFATDIKPLFDASCVKCHGAQKPKAGLRLDSLANVLAGSEEGKVFTLGDSSKGKLVTAIARINPKTAMPPEPRGPRRGGPAGPGGPGSENKPGATGGGDKPADAPHVNPTNAPTGDGNRPPGGPGGPGGRNQGPPPKPLTAEEVGLVRAWIDQGAK